MTEGTLNFNKIKKKIGWVYKTKYKGLSETIDWYIKNKSFFKKFQKRIYSFWTSNINEKEDSIYRWKW